ncbi:GNAT family N-acetyltransferase [Niveibacterium sp.]|uniref:GNAT family N-acetyltransferase n=1 Tax=Niveibacterium sp. TaxID=2017444 RepID=UPI0035B1E273
MNTSAHPFVRHPASALAFDALLAIWNEAYRGYFVPFQFDEAMLRRHIALGSVDLDRSCVWYDGDTPMAVALAGVRGTRAWLGGWGIAPDWRGKRHSLPLVRDFMQVQVAAGALEIQLEALEHNWALRTYAQAGFVDTRRLLVLEGALTCTPVAGHTLSFDAALQALAALPRASACWQRDLQALRAQPDLMPVGVGPDEAPTGVALPRVDGDWLRIIDLACTPQATSALLAALAACAGGRQLRLVNEPEGRLAEALCTAGLVVANAQREMVWRVS